jgi:hypothetical protein
MRSSHYEVGLSGHGTRVLLSRTEDLFTLGEALPPGSYWITRHMHPARSGTRFAPVDWGTLEVPTDGRWMLRGPGNLQVGPGYAVV